MPHSSASSADPPPRDRRTRRRVTALGSTLLRTAIVVSIFAILLARSDPQKLQTALQRAVPGFVVIALAVFLVGLAVNAIRWRQFLRPLALDLPTIEVQRLYFAGTFFNTFLPTGFGGDAYRAMMMRSVSGSAAAPLATAILDRIAGFVGLALLTTGAIVAGSISARGGVVTLIGLGLSIAVVVVAALLLWLSPRWSSRGARRTTRLRSQLDLFSTAFSAAGRDPTAVLRGLSLGVMSALLLVGVNWTLVRSVDASVPLAALPGVVLIASSATVLPLSINGIGLREAAYVWCLTRYGVNYDTALAIALLVLAVLLVAGAICGSVYVLAGGKVRAPKRAPQ